MLAPTTSDDQLQQSEEKGTFQHSVTSVFAKLPAANRNAQDYNNFCRGVKLLFHDNPYASVKSKNYKNRDNLITELKNINTCSKNKS